MFLVTISIVRVPAKNFTRTFSVMINFQMSVPCPFLGKTKNKHINSHLKENCTV
jgi:hypothetical protein